jgi:gliding motility-associated-like protein
MKTVFLILILAFCLPGIHASNITWTGNHSNEWNHVENWNPLIVPNNLDDVTIPSTWSGQILIDGANASCKTITYNGTGFTLKIANGWEFILNGNLNVTGHSKILGPGGIEIAGSNDCHLNYSDSTIIDVSHVNVKSTANVFLSNPLIMPLGQLNVYSGNFISQGNEINVNAFNLQTGSLSRSINIDNSIVTSFITNLYVWNGGNFSAINSVFNNKLLIQTDGNVSFNVVNSDDKSTISTIKNNTHISITELNAWGSLNMLGDNSSISQSFSIVTFKILYASSIIKLSPEPCVSGYHFYTIQTPSGCAGDIFFTDEAEVNGNQVQFHIIGGAHLAKASFANIRVVSGALIVDKGMDVGNNNGIIFNQTSPTSFYWVNGGGNWNDPNHWSLTSGGTTAGCIPGLNDHVIFNNGSGFATNDTVMIGSHTFCNNLIADAALVNKPVFASAMNTKHTLNIAGNMDLRGFSSYQVLYKIYFRNKGTSFLYTGSHTILDNLYFTNKGTIELKNNLNCDNGLKSISQWMGSLKTNGFNIETSSFISKGLKQPATKRGLILNNSKIYTGHTLMTPGNIIIYADSMALNAGTSEFIFPYMSNQIDQLKIDGFSELHFYNVSFFNPVGVPQLNFNQVSSFNKVHYYGNGKILGCNAQIVSNMSSIDTLIITGKYSYEIQENTRLNIRKQLITQNGICNDMCVLRSTSLAGKAYLHSTSPFPLDLKNIWIENMEATGNNIPVVVTNGVNGGNNSNFNFASLNQSQIFYWNGEAANSHWSNGENWNIGVLPHPGNNNDKILYNTNVCTPGYNDSVVFHLNSFPVIDTVLINENANFKGMMWMLGTGTNKHITGSAEYTLNNYGGLEFDSNLQIDYSGDLFLRGPLHNQIYFRNVTYPGSIIFYNLGSYALKDQLTCLGYSIEFRAGCFSTGGNNIETNRITIRHEYAPSNINNIIDFGNSRINIQLSFLGNFFHHVSTLLADQSEIKYFSAGAVMTVLGNHHDLQFGNINFSSNNGNVALVSNYYGTFIPHYKHVNFESSGVMYGENSIDTLILAEGKEYQLESFATQYINDLLYSKGSPCFRTTITSTQPGSRALIKNEHCNLIVEHARVRDIEGILGSCGVNNYLVGVGGENMGNNLNWNFIPGNPVNGLGADTILTCKTIPYTQTSLGFGRYESIVWNTGSTSPDLIIDSVCTISATVVYSPTCIVTDSRIFDFNNELLQNATVNNISCFGMNNGSIELTISDVDTTYSQNWIYPDLHTRTGSTTINNLHAGIYTSIVNVPGYEALCNDTIQFTINEPSLLTVELDTTITGKCSDPDGIILISTQGGTGELTYTWSNENTNEDNYSVSGGINSVTVTDTNGCIANLSVDMDCVDHLNIPELLTPNDDGYSDNWEIIDLFRLYPNNNVKILNRWGNMVYQKQGYNNEFTGLPNTDTLSRGYLPSGTYFYVIDLGKGYKTLTGYIELIY